MSSHSMDPFQLEFGHVQVTPVSTYSIPIFIRNQTPLRLNCALLISTPTTGVQDIREIGELDPNQRIRLYYEVTSMEELMFEAVVRTTQVRFRGNKGKIQGEVCDLEGNKAFVRLKRLEKCVSEAIFRCEFQETTIKVTFPDEIDELYQFFPLNPSTAQFGVHEDIWQVEISGETSDFPLKYTLKYMEE